MGLSGDRRLLAAIAGSLILILIAIGLYVLLSNPSPPATGSPPAEAPQSDRPWGIIGPVNGSYLNTPDGDATRIYLIDSDMRYGTFGRDYLWPPQGYLAKKGAPCVIVNGTIRNDYDTDYYVGLVAYAYNESGGRVGNIVNTGMGDPWFRFMTYHVPGKNTEPFEIYINYNDTDVGKYEVYAIFTSASPPP